MANHIVAKLLATYFYITIVIAWNPPDEYDQLKSLSNQIDNLKSLLNQPNRPQYTHNYGLSVPWDNNNRNSDYERYLKQQYILPILNSITDISEQIIKANNEKTQYQSISSPFSMNYIPPRPNLGDIGVNSSPFNAPFGTASGWGTASYGKSQSQNSGGSSYSSGSNPLSISSSFSDGFGSYPPIRTDSHNLFSGDSSGPPVIPSRFPSLSNREPAHFDDNQNWGLVPGDNDDNVRSSPKPPQECNCDEENKNVTSLALKLRLKTSETNPATCKAVILFCCVPENNEERRKECFTEHGCPRSYSTGIACLPVLIKAVYTDIYGHH